MRHPLTVWRPTPTSSAVAWSVLPTTRQSIALSYSTVRSCRVLSRFVAIESSGLRGQQRRNGRHAIVGNLLAPTLRGPQVASWAMASRSSAALVASTAAGRSGRSSGAAARTRHAILTKAASAAPASTPRTSAPRRGTKRGRGVSPPRGEPPHAPPAPTVRSLDQDSTTPGVTTCERTPSARRDRASSWRERKHRAPSRGGETGARG